MRGRLIRMSHYLVLAAHSAYFGLVFLETHYTYGFVAGGLAIATIAEAFFGEDNHG